MINFLRSHPLTGNGQESTKASADPVGLVRTGLAGIGLELSLAGEVETLMRAAGIEFVPEVWAEVGVIAFGLPGAPAQFPGDGGAMHTAYRGLSAKHSDDLILPPLRRANFVSRLNYTETSGGRTIHELRHTYATILITRGVKLDTISEWMGHKNTTTTSKIYVHWLGSDENRTTIKRLNKQHR